MDSFGTHRSTQCFPIIHYGVFSEENQLPRSTSVNTLHIHKSGNDATNTKKSITSIRMNTIFTRHPRSPQRRTTPYQRRRYHQGTYGYPCFSPAQTDRSEQLNIIQSIITYQKWTQLRYRFPQEWFHPSEPQTWPQSLLRACGYDALSSLQGSYEPPPSFPPCW